MGAHSSRVYIDDEVRAEISAANVMQFDGISPEDLVIRNASIPDNTNSSDFSQWLQQLEGATALYSPVLYRVQAREVGIIGKPIRSVRYKKSLLNQCTGTTLDVAKAILLILDNPTQTFDITTSSAETVDLLADFIRSFYKTETMIVLSLDIDNIQRW